ncbi:MAG: DNA repair protein RadC [Oscillospiraceae bacterium]|nr:DNA repair protein RadC [Oscillospiraceae bacterium]
MDRLLRDFRRNPDSLTDQELLELLLRFTSSDAGSLAERITEIYPSLSALMGADGEALSAVEGMDENSKTLLCLIPELQRRYFLSDPMRRGPLLNGGAYGRYLLPYFFGARDELVYLLLLDDAGKVLNCRKIASGSVNYASVPVRRLVQEALNVNASGLVLAHNHPSGIAIPSKEDVDLTLRLRDALEIIGIEMLDHIIVADDDCISMRDSGYLR